MKTYIVTAAIEIEAMSDGEAEDIVMDAILGHAGYIEIKEVKELV